MLFLIPVYFICKYVLGVIGSSKDSDSTNGKLLIFGKVSLLLDVLFVCRTSFFLE